MVPGFFFKHLCIYSWYNLHFAISNSENSKLNYSVLISSFQMSWFFFFIYIIFYDDCDFLFYFVVLKERAESLILNYKLSEKLIQYKTYVNKTSFVYRKNSFKLYVYFEYFLKILSNQMDIHPISKPVI